MPKERDVSSEQILYLLMDFRERDAKLDKFTKIEVNRNECREIGIFSYIDKERGEKKTSRLFLISEIHDGKKVSIIYDEKGGVIAWKDHAKNELQVAQNIDLNRKMLERQISLDEEKTRNLQDNNTSSSDTLRGGDGRDKGQKEHENIKVKDEREQDKKLPNEEPKKLENLKGKINDYERMPKIRLNQIINGYRLWEILKLEEKLKGRLPEGISESSFRNGYLTMMETGKMSEIGEKEYKLAISTTDGDIVELDESILEPQYLGSRQERMEKENKRYRIADGEETRKPDRESSLTQMAKWKIKDLDGFETGGEDWYLAIDMNKEYRENASYPSNGKTTEISFIQENNLDRGMGRERTRESVEYKLEDISEPALNAKEEKHMEQLRKRELNEAKNTRKEHLEELKEVVEKLTNKYGEDYRKIIEEQVEQEHKKGKDIEDIEKNVKENIDDLQDEYFRHGRTRNH